VQHIEHGARLPAIEAATTDIRTLIVARVLLRLR
jgi:hypothetical protein